MHLYPAIDVRGDGLARATSPADPVSVARALASAGSHWAHVVDLDRVFGTGRRDALVRAVIDALGGTGVQLGGGLRTGPDVAEAIGWGAARVIVGADAAPDLPALVSAVGGERLGLAIDVRDGVTTSPAGAVVGEAPEALVASALGAGVPVIVYRDRDRDGTLRGADFSGAASLAASGVAVVFAGGVAGLDDLRRARDLGFAGVIVGRALLAERFTLQEALACCG